MRLLLIEDEEDLASAITRGLKRQGYAVDAAASGEDGCRLAEVNGYDLLVLDLNLPGMDGLDVLHRLRATQPELLVLVLTARGRPEERVAGLDLGADDYLPKPFHFQELSARIRALLRRDLRTREPVLRWGDLALDPAARIAWQAGRRLEVTRKELAILEYLMRRPGEVVSQGDILEHVWSGDGDAFSNAVRVHIGALRRKLGDNASAPRYLETLPSEGYRLLPSPGGSS